ncbi:ARABIDOPSIS THALIANA INOSITOL POLYPHOSPHATE 5-PHOSPHATASE 11 [Hibiscus trionum]|uniref:ARABIDOPSIS THALIANA INOSITOL POLYPHOSPHATE 5-PHOSPHATASE 11 n=1 Tax=Hibiscus trionum TaxID=183268 RepID=A0A9W7I9X5_HIBTR|nr:ARABIDOPSIS THALIANA INOSITOL POLYPHOSPHATE 5-PHOSPHATASE 11 [Hibiscus trionum]
MGNFSTTQVSGKGRRSKLKKKSAVGSFSNPVGTHEGIKTVEADNLCIFSRNSGLCICIVTWNMNGQVSSEDLVELIGRNRRFDLLVVGLQEVARDNVAQFLQDAVVETHELVGKAVMQSLQLYVFGPKNSDLFIKDLKVDKHSVGGFGGMMRRKKGAVAIRICYKEFRIVFITCHLSAHARNVEERNAQCRHISQSLFSKYWNPYARPPQITIWLGDLNYRLQGINTHPARNLIQRNLHGLLRSKDQLHQEAERRQIFNGYCEGTLTFKPTYKYNVGSSNYDTSYKVRVPSWTDRILFKIRDPDKITASLHCYESVDDIHSSDHKPVRAHICFRVNK